jgi:hypothetical protein
MSNTPTGSGGATAKYVVAAVVLSAVAGATIWLWRTRGGPYVDTLPPRLVASAGLVAVAAAVLALYLWRRASLWRLRRAEHAAREALLAKAGQAADEANAKLVGLVAVTLEWAVRAELVREDVRDVEEYMLHLAKRPGIRRVLVARRDGLVIAATDKKLRNQKLDRVVEGLPPESSDIHSAHAGGRLLRLVVPVMGLESRLGTLVLEYEHPDILPALRAAA